MNDPAQTTDSIDRQLQGHALKPRRGVGAVLAGWGLSIGLHALGLGLMLLIVFPFRASSEESEMPRINAQIIGEVDAPPSNTRSSASAAAQAISDPSTPRFQPNPSAAPGSGGGLSGGDGGGGGTGIGPYAPARSGSDLNMIGIGAGSGGAGIGLGPDGGGSVEFFGTGGAVQGVRHVVYVVDRSGSMALNFQLVCAELRRSIGALRRSQKFHVVFFNTGDPLENPPQRLVPAIASFKEQFSQFLDTVTTTGGTKPERALKRALALQPDILYLLSDGINFDPELMSKLNDWNRDRKTRIFTIAYLDQEGRAVLENIAREHGGEFKFVSDDDLP